MIYSYRNDGVFFDLVDPELLIEPERNLFSADAFTLVVGGNGAGKTHFLSGLANEVVKEKGGVVRSNKDSGNEFIIFYTSSPFNGVRPRNNDRIRCIGPKSPKAVVSHDLLTSISAAFSASGVAELKLGSDYKSGLRSVVSSVFEMPLKLRGELIDSIQKELRIYHETSMRWVSLSSSGESESAAIAKREMESMQKEIHALVERRLTGRFSLSQYRLGLHALDLAIKRNKRGRRILVQHLLDYADGQYPAGTELDSAMSEINLAVKEYGEKLLSGQSARIRRKIGAAPTHGEGGALVFAMAGSSSGESALFDQFAKIENQLKAVSGQDRNLIIMIDEGDAFLHFKWQQKYIKFLDAFVASVKAKFKSIQVILTTHSPILMSDVPSGNVIRLGEGGQMCTFGAPLERIVSSTVGAGSIGDFAAEKISSMMERKHYVDAYIVDQIDDGFIRAELRRVL